MSDAVIVVVGKDAYRVELYAEVNGVRDDEPVATWALPDGLDAGKAPGVLAGGSIAKSINEFVADNRSAPEFVQIGQYLGGLLLPENGPREAWRALNADRTRLEIEPSGLRTIPWEMTMCGNDALFLQTEYTTLRAHSYEEAPPCWSLPVRLLVVEGEQSDEIDTRTEIRAIKRALATSNGWVEAEFLSMPTAKQLRETYTRFAPHIFHFVGHCDEMIGTDESALWVGPPDDQWPIGATAIANMLRPAPRLAVLNACRTAQQIEHVDALIDVFIQSGSVAVIGMQADIDGSAAAVFGEDLYRALIDGAGIDAAVARARMAIYTHNGVTDARDWFLPSLTLRAAPCDVLPEIGNDEGQQVNKSIGTFVDRLPERQQLVGGADPDVEAKAERLLLVTGDQEAGKTSLVNWLLRRCAIRARQVRYVDFESTDNFGFLSMLYHIRDTLVPVPSPYPNGKAPFDRFNYDLGYYRKGQFPVEPEGDLVTLSKPPRPKALKKPPPGLVEHLFQSFRNGLSAYCAGQPLVLILDHVEQVRPFDFRDQVLPHLLQPAMGDHVPGVRFVVVLTADKLGQHWPDERRGLQINLSYFERELFVSLAEEVYLACGREIPPHFEEFYNFYLMELPAGQVRPYRLDRVAELAKKLVN